MAIAAMMTKGLKCQWTELQGIIVPALPVDGDVMLSHTVVDVCRLAMSLPARAVCALPSGIGETGNVQ
jgi:hypothetical protein